MTPEMRKSWCDALRSGKYEQCHGTLKGRISTGEGYCCLGVLAVVAGPDLGAAGVAVRLRDGAMELASDDETSAGELPTRGLHALGLTIDQQIELITLNDDESRDFPYIAKWIEENVGT